MSQDGSKSQNLRLLDDETITTGEAVTLSDGMHTGTIKAAYGEQTPQGYKYFQLEIQPDEEPEITLRYGCAMPNEGRNVTPASKLGKLLQAFGVDISPGNSLSVKDMKAATEGRKVRFATLNEDVVKDGKKKGTFAVVVENSVKPTKA